jgi:DNA-binding response OmpR family regulator
MSAKDHRVLIVDDIADNLFLLKAFLESEGFNVEVADNGTSALEKMQLFPPHLVLLDVMMPDMNGYQLTQAIRRNSRFSALPVVLITAHIEACRIKGLAAGATDFVRKPLDFEELLSKIQSLLAHRGLRN